MHRRFLSSQLSPKNDGLKKSNDSGNSIKDYFKVLPFPRKSSHHMFVIRFELHALYGFVPLMLSLRKILRVAC